MPGTCSLISPRGNDGSRFFYLVLHLSVYGNLSIADAPLSGCGRNLRSSFAGAKVRQLFHPTKSFSNFFLTFFIFLLISAYLRAFPRTRARRVPYIYLLLATNLSKSFGERRRLTAVCETRRVLVSPATCSFSFCHVWHFVLRRVAFHFATCDISLCDVWHLALSRVDSEE